MPSKMWLQRKPEEKIPRIRSLWEDKHVSTPGPGAEGVGRSGRRVVMTKVDTCCLNKQKAEKLWMNLSAGALDLNLGKHKCRWSFYPSNSLGNFAKMGLDSRRNFMLLPWGLLHLKIAYSSVMSLQPCGLTDCKLSQPHSVANSRIHCPTMYSLIRMSSDFDICQDWGVEFLCCLVCALLERGA